MSTDTSRLDYVVTGQAQLAALDKQLERIQTLMMNLGKARDISAFAQGGFDKVGGDVEKIRTGVAGLKDSLATIPPVAADAGRAMSEIAAGGRTGGAWKEEVARINGLNTGLKNIGSAAPAAATALTATKQAAVDLGRSVPTGQIDQFTTAFKHGIATAGTFASKLAILMIAFLAFRAVQTIIRGVIQGFKDLDEATRKIISASAVAGEANTSYAGTFLTVAYNAVKYRTAIKDVGDATWELESAGLSASEALAGTGTVLKLLTADVTDVGTSTRLVAGIYRTFKDELGATASEAEKFARVGDVLAYALNRSQVNMEGLINGLKHSLGVAATAGIQFEVLVASLAVMNDHMMMGAIAGTGMRAALIQLSQDIEFLAERYDLVVDRSKSWGEQLMPVLEQLNQRINSGNLSIGEMSELLKSTGARGGQAILVLTQYFDDLDAMVKALETDAEGALDAMSGVRMDSFTRNLDAAKTSAKSFGATLFGPMMNGLNTMLSGLNDVSAELFRLGALFAKKYDLKLSISDDEIEKMKWWQRALLDAGKIIGGMLLPGSGLYASGMGDLFSWAADGLAKIGEEAGMAGDAFDKLYETMGESGRASMIEAMIGPVEMLSVRMAEGTVTAEDYRDAIDFLTATLDDHVYEYVRLTAEIERAKKEQNKSAEELATMQSRWNELGKAIASDRKEIAGLTKDLNKFNNDMEKISDRKLWTLDTLFGLDEIKTEEYLAQLKKYANEAMLYATKLSTNQPGSDEANEAQRRAYELMNKYADETSRAAGAMANLSDKQREFLRAGLEGMALDDEASISMLRDRIWYFEQYKKTLSDPQDILEVDKALMALNNTLAGKGENRNWDLKELFEEMQLLKKELVDPVADLGNKFDGLDEALKAGFIASLTNMKDGIVPGITTNVETMATGFDSVRTVVNDLNGSLNLTLSVTSVIMQNLYKIAKSRNFTGANSPDESTQSINQQLKSGD